MSINRLARKTEGVRIKNETYGDTEKLRVQDTNKNSRDTNVPKRKENKKNYTNVMIAQQ